MQRETKMKSLLKMKETVRMKLKTYESKEQGVSLQHLNRQKVLSSESGGRQVLHDRKGMIRCSFIQVLFIKFSWF